MMSGNYMTPGTVEVANYKSNAEILATGRIEEIMKYEAMVMYYDDELRDLKSDRNEDSPSNKRKRSSEPDAKKCIDVMCLDRTGPLSGTLFSPVAELFMKEIGRSPNNRVIQLDKVRVLGFPKNSWNGNFLTRCRKFETVERSGSSSAS